MNHYFFLLTVLISTYSFGMFSGFPQSSGAAVAESMERLAKAKANREKTEGAYQQGNYLERVIIQAIDQFKGTGAQLIDQIDTTATKQIEAIDNKAAERINQINDICGAEARTTIHSASGDIFKGVFCSAVAFLGALLVYQNLCTHQDEKENDQKQEKYIKAGIGGTCVVAAGILGHYWFS